MHFTKALSHNLSLPAQTDVLDPRVIPPLNHLSTYLFNDWGRGRPGILAADEHLGSCGPGPTTSSFFFPRPRTYPTEGSGHQHQTAALAGGQAGQRERRRERWPPDWNGCSARRGIGHTGGNETAHECLIFLVQGVHVVIKTFFFCLCVFRWV